MKPPFKRPRLELKQSSIQRDDDVITSATCAPGDETYGDADDDHDTDDSAIDNDYDTAAADDDDDDDADDDDKFPRCEYMKL